MKGKNQHFDVAILGGGLAGMSLCRHLLMSGFDGRILVLERKSQIPGKQQKVGESLVQVAGYYFSKVLDLEEHLFRSHYLKYNLRFYWKTPGRSNRNFEDYGQSYIRPLSNVCSYQLDRNVLEKHLADLNESDPNVTIVHPAIGLRVDLADGEPHQIRFKSGGEQVTVTADWVVDTTGRGQFLKGKQKLYASSPIQHASIWCWVDGLVNIEKLTDLSLQQIRTKPDRREQGWIPLWLATNHFMGEGFWFWVIPLQGLTSLGLVFDKAVIPPETVSTPEELIRWACREFPLFERDLSGRKILDSARLPDYAYDCRQTISPSRWAMSGMAGRFTDPLYSPGSDLISYYNTMIVDTILEKDPEAMRKKCELYEALMRVVYEAYVPSYEISYDVLGDQEAFSMKYSWELAIYFSFYVFPFVNDFFTNEKFVRMFFRKFAQLGPINRSVQEFLSGYFQWKKSNGVKNGKVLNDFFDLTPLRRAETAFYEVGVSVDRAEEVLDFHLGDMKEFARYIYAYVSSVLLDDPEVVNNQSFVSSIKLKSFRFEPGAIRRAYRSHRDCKERYEWTLDSMALERFRSCMLAPEPEARVATAPEAS